MGGESHSGTDIDALLDANDKHCSDMRENEAAARESQKTVDASKNSPFVVGALEARSDVASRNVRSAQTANEFGRNYEKLQQEVPNMTDEQRARFEQQNQEMAQNIYDSAARQDPKLEEKLAKIKERSQDSPELPPDPSMQMGASIPFMQTYINMGMKVSCPFSPGSQIPLTVLPDKRVLLEGTPMANIMDKELINIPSFGMCNAPSNPAVISATAAAMGVPTPAPCVPSIIAPWMMGKTNVLVGGKPALLSTDTCQCMWGGVITFLPDSPSSQTGKGDGSTNNPFLTILKNKATDVPEDVLKKAAEKKAAEKAGGKVAKAALGKAAGVGVWAVFTLGSFAWKKAHGESFNDPAGFGNYLRDKGMPDFVADLGSHVVSDAAETGQATVQLIDGHNKRLENAGMKMGSPQHVRWMAARH